MHVLPLTVTLSVALLAVCMSQSCKTPARSSSQMTSTQNYLSAQMDKWHKAAAEADETTFFGMMAADAVYLGTDASERWTREEMRVWSKPYFDKTSAWVLTPTQRTVYVAPEGSYAWFEEKLSTTHMGECRGSGVWRRTAKGNWELVHYNLAIAVPNALVKPLLELQQK